MRRTTLLAAIMAAGIPTAATAAEDTNILPALTVTGPRPSPSLTAPAPDEAREAIRQTPGGVDVVPSEAYRDGRAQTLKDVLDYVPGVFVQPRWAEESRLSIRGSGLARSSHMRGIKLMQDGIPLNSADGFADFQQLDPLTARHFEVYKGANALQYGAAYLGGAINAQSFTGSNSPGSLLRIDGGPRGYKRGQAYFAGSEGPVDFYISPSKLVGNGYREHTAQDSNRLSANLGWRPAGGVETRFYLNANDIRQELSSGLTKAQFSADPSQTGNVNNIRNNAKRDIQSLRMANKTSVLLDDWQLEGGVYAAVKELYHPLSTVVIDQTSEDIGTFARGMTEGSLFGRKNQVLLGVNYAYGQNDAKTFGTNFGRRGALTSQTQHYYSNIEIYGEDRWWATPELALIAGGQALVARREAKDQFLSNGNASGDATYRAFSPRIGALWQPAPERQFFGNFSRSVEPPIMSDVNPSAFPNSFAPLDAQESWTAEIGTRGREGRFGWDLGLYRSWLKHELQNFAIGNTSYSANTDRTIHQGVELGFDLDLWRAGGDVVNWRNAYTYSDYYFSKDPLYQGKDIPGAPPHYYRSELRYTHSSGFHVAPNVEWVPQSYYVDNANTLKTRPYYLIGLKGGMELLPGVNAYFDARNLADVKYIASATTVPVAAANSAVFSPGDGIGIFAGLEVKW